MKKEKTNEKQLIRSLYQELPSLLSWLQPSSLRRRRTSRKKHKKYSSCFHQLTGKNFSGGEYF
jgi:hypothetical protein